MSYMFFCRTCGLTLVTEYYTKPRKPCDYCGDIGWRKRPIKRLDLFELRKRGLLNEHGSYIDPKGSGDQE